MALFLYTVLRVCGVGVMADSVGGGEGVAAIERWVEDSEGL